MSESFKNIANNEDYDLTNGNCATVVQRVMLDAGLKIHDEEPQIIHHDGNPLVCIPPLILKYQSALVVIHRMRLKKLLMSIHKER